MSHQIGVEFTLNRQMFTNISCQAWRRGQPLTQSETNANQTRAIRHTCVCSFLSPCGKRRLVRQKLFNLPRKTHCAHAARRSASRVAKIYSRELPRQTCRRRVTGSSSPVAGQIMSVTGKWIINIEQRASLLLIVTRRGNKFSDCLTLLANLT